MKPITVSVTYATYDERSLEAGEPFDGGFELKDEPVTFKELVEMIEDGGYCNPSDCPGLPRWLSADPDIDYRTGVEVERSLHPGEDARSQRYWEKAIRATERTHGVRL